jgi:hypothetical protein
MGLLRRWLTDHCPVDRWQSLIQPGTDTECKNWEETPLTFLNEMPSPADSCEIDELLKLKQNNIAGVDYTDYQLQLQHKVQFV